MIQFGRNFLLAALAVFGALAVSHAAAQQQLTVFAAASLTEALGEAGKAYGAKSGQPVRFGFASSATLARQIEAGAAADLFVSADSEWMDYVASRALIVPASRRVIARGRLVLIAPAASPLAVRVGKGGNILAALGPDGRIALADPDSVPAGRYAKAAFEQSGEWAVLSGRVARAENVRAALALVARGEAPLGVVYETDARIEPRVRIAATFPETSHPPILYPAAVLRTAQPGAQAFLAFLTGREGQAILARHGFRAAPGAR